MQQIKLSKILVKVIESDQQSIDLRQLCVELLLKMGLVSSNAEFVLRAAIYQQKYQIDLTKEIEFFCKDDEQYYEPHIEDHDRF